MIWFIIACMPIVIVCVALEEYVWEPRRERESRERFKKFQPHVSLLR